MVRSYVTLALIVCITWTVVYAATISDSVLEKFTEQEKQYQLPAGILAKIAKIESNGDTNAHPSCSGCSALGLFQWTKDSWLSATQSLYGSPKELDLRRNPFISTEVTAFATAQTKSQVGPSITSAGVDMSVGLYMGHFLGIGGAKKFFGLMIQDRNAQAASYFPKAADSNKTIFYGGQNGTRTFAEIVNLFATKMKQPGVTVVSGYSGTLSPISENGRIMDMNGDSGLSQQYGGFVPAVDPEFDYQSSYTSRQPNGQQQSPYYNNSNNNTNPSKSNYNPSVTPSIQNIPTTSSLLSIPIATSSSISNIFDTGSTLSFPTATSSSPSGNAYKAILGMNFDTASTSASSSVSSIKVVNTTVVSQNIASITSVSPGATDTVIMTSNNTQNVPVSTNTFVETAPTNTNTSSRFEKLSILESMKQILLAIQVILFRIKNPFS